MIKKLEECVDQFLSESVFTQFMAFELKGQSYNIEEYSRHKLNIRFHSKSWFTEVFKSKLWVFDVLFPEEDDQEVELIISDGESNGFFYELSSEISCYDTKLWFKSKFSYGGS